MILFLIRLLNIVLLQWFLVRLAQFEYRNADGSFRAYEYGFIRWVIPFTAIFSHKSIVIGEIKFTPLKTYNGVFEVKSK